MIVAVAGSADDIRLTIAWSETAVPTGAHPLVLDRAAAH